MGVRRFAASRAALLTGWILCGANVGDAATKRVPTGELPLFHDDLKFAGLSEALARQRARSQSAGQIILGGTKYSTEDVRESFERFHQLSEQASRCLRDNASETNRRACRGAFQHAIASEFAVYTTSEPARLTAYYTPTIDVSRTPDGEFRFPIYGLPDSPKLRRLRRRDIDFHDALAGNGLELFYARSRFDIYVLQVEGGGRVRIKASGNRVAEGQVSYLSYAGANDRRGPPIEEYMLRHDMLRPEDISRHAQRRYLQMHPEKAERIYASVPWYVFFKETREPPLSSIGTPLTANRSMASDPTYYPVKGLIVFVKAPLPLFPQQPVPLESDPVGLREQSMSRFFLDQDEGPYIKGAARFDLYFGEDRYAEFLANNFRTRGQVFFLVLKKRAGER